MDNHNLILLIDMDGPLCNWVKGVTDALRREHPEILLPGYDALTNFDIHTYLTPDHSKIVREITASPGFYENLDPEPGAVDALKDIEDHFQGYITPFICSSPSVPRGAEFPWCHSEKIAWVQDKLGSFWANRTILTKDKTLVRGHLLIDDNPKIKGVVEPTWAQIIYARPWNALLDDTRMTWDNWPTLRGNIIATVEKNRAIQTEASSKIILSSRG